MKELVGLLIIVWAFASWLTHVVITIKAIMSGTAVFGYAVFLLVGAIIPFIGMIHGTGVWMGAW